MSGLYGELKKYSLSDYYAFHMPGHKRLMGSIGDPEKIDITEISGFDDLNHPEEGGLLTEAQKRAAALYGAQETHFLINGSTAGILSAVLGCAKRGDRILMARNCHRSVYNAVEIGMLRPEYVYPADISDSGINGPVSPADIKKALDGGVSAVVITSPTYDGVCSDVRAAADLCHGYGIPLIVDQAHGAHFPFSDYFPEDALKQGADVVIHSLHKTLPSLTQTGLLHIQGGIADRERIRRYLTVFQSSSPSYVLMASIDSCVGLLRDRGDELFGAYTGRLENFREKCGCLKNLRLESESLLLNFNDTGNTDFDRSRLIISTEKSGLSGMELMNILRDEYRLEMEMSAPGYVLGISGVADTSEGFERLAEALGRTDEKLCPCETLAPSARVKLSPASVMSPGEAVSSGNNTEYVSLNDAAGRISASYIYLYPPGVPAAVPGEVIDGAVTAYIKELSDKGCRVHGLKADKDGAGKIRVMV